MMGIAGLSPAAWTAVLAAEGVEGQLGRDLARFLALLSQWSTAVDLLAGADPEGVVREHVVPSLAGVPFLTGGGALLDIGSGNGFPAVPLLLGARSVSGVLLEPRERRWAFLAEAVRELGLAAKVLRERARSHRGGPYEAVSVRGVAESEWGGEIGRLVRPGGLVLWWTGRGAAGRAAAWPGGSVVTSEALPVGQGVLVVWRRCFT